MIPDPTPPPVPSAPPSREECIAATELEAFRQQNQTPPEALEARLRETTLEGLLMEFVRQSECVWDTVHDHIQLLKGGEKRLDLEGEAAERLWNVWAGTHPPIVLVEKVARLAAEVARLTALLEDHGPDGRNVTNAQHLAMRERAQAAEERAGRAEARVREAYRTVVVRAAERDQLDRRLMSVVVERYAERLALAEVLGMVDEDGMPPEWSKMVTRVNELRTTLRARRDLASLAGEARSTGCPHLHQNEAGMPAPPGGHVLRWRCLDCGAWSRNAGLRVGESAALESGKWPAWATDGARDLREVVETLNICIDALEGRDGADVCTDLAVAVHRIDMVSEAVALALDVPSTLTEDHVE